MNCSQSSASWSLLSSVSLGYEKEVKIDSMVNCAGIEDGLSNWVLTSLGDDGSSGDNDDWPVELAFQVLHDLFSDLSETGQGSVWNLDEQALAS